MHYYQFHIGDYASHTNNLSLLEDLAYRRLLDIYYRDEGLSECCEQEIARSIGMKDYQDEVSYILKKYFKKAKKGFKQSKADRDIKVYHSKADAARANGKLGGRPKKTQDKPSRLAEKSESKTNHEPITNNHKPVTSKPNKDKIPYQLVADEYNKFATNTNNPQITTITDKRKTIIKKAWQLDTDNANLKLRSNNTDYWKRLFNHASGSEFLNGNAQRGEGHANWKPSFEFILREDTHLKIREGNY